MRPTSEPEDLSESTCTFVFFDCLSPSRPGESFENERRHTGIEREMRIMYQQPHLVPPMKLTVFDDMPPTPTPAPPSQLLQWVSQGKASLRSSFSTRRHTSTKVTISSPRPAISDADQLPFRRGAQDFRPLELSIYMPTNRLSNLPEFDRLSFTEGGEIKMPPRALIRTKSEEFVPNKVSMMPAPIKPASMIEQRRLSHFRPDTSSTVMSISRPPSEYDALHSHPVSWASFPGIPPPIHLPGRSEPSVAVLTPMQEEFSPPATAVTVDGTVLHFPKDLDRPSVSSSEPERLSSEAHAPAPYVPINATRNFSKPSETTMAAGYFHPNYHTQKRISQWLAHCNSSSISTHKSSSSASSFAEHRRKRSQFYQLSGAPPKALALWPGEHQRTMTESTIASTIDTDAVAPEYQSRTDTSMTTMDMLSGAIGSVSKGLTRIVSGVPDIPPGYAEATQVSGDDMIIKEIGGPLRSPGVGVAF